MRVLGLDFETTGLESESDRVIEVGAAVWDVATKKPLTVLSDLVLPNPFSGLAPEITKITGITDQALREYGRDGNEVFERLILLANSCDYIVAHNAEFDRGFFKSEANNYGFSFPQTPWVDTMVDVPYPEDMTTRKLTYLAAEHGMVNSYAHRALFDVMVMLKVMAEYDFSEIQQRQKSPGVEVISHVTYENRNKAKDLGFRWDGERKKWHKFMKQCDLDEVQFPFEVTVSAPECV